MALNSFLTLASGYRAEYHVVGEELARAYQAANEALESAIPREGNDETDSSKSDSDESQSNPEASTSDNRGADAEAISLNSNGTGRPAVA